MKVLLVGDDPGTLRRLKMLVENIGSLTFAATASNIDEAENAVDRLEPDVVLFDVETQGGVGARRAQRLLGKVRPELIFVSAQDEFAREALDLDAAGYLRKPVRIERLGAAMSRVRARRDLRRRSARLAVLESSGGPIDQAEGMWVQSRTGHIWLSMSDVAWVEAAGDYVLLHSGGESHMHRITMGALASQIRDPGFLRIHRSFMVKSSSIARVERVGRALIAILKDGTELAVGPKYRAAFVSLLGLPGRSR